MVAWFIIFIMGFVLFVTVPKIDKDLETAPWLTRTVFIVGMTGLVVSIMILIVIGFSFISTKIFFSSFFYYNTV